MAIRDGVLLLLAYIPGLAEEGALSDLVTYLRDGTGPVASGTGTVLVESMSVLQAPGDASAVTGTLALGETCSCWRQVGAWWFVSTGSLAGWVYEGWISVA